MAATCYVYISSITANEAIADWEWSGLEMNAWPGNLVPAPLHVPSSLILVCELCSGRPTHMRVNAYRMTARYSHEVNAYRMTARYSHEVNAYRMTAAELMAPCWWTLNIPLSAIIRIPVARARNWLPTPAINNTL